MGDETPDTSSTKQITVTTLWCRWYLIDNTLRVRSAKSLLAYEKELDATDMAININKKLSYRRDSARCHLRSLKVIRCRAYRVAYMTS